MDELPYQFDSAVEPTLFHYTNVQAAEAIVSSQSIRLSEFTAMNDPSEFAYAKGELNALLDADSPHLDFAPHYALAHAFEQLESSTGLLLGSMTTRRDDLTQWRLYGDNGQGCVLGIDAAYLEHDVGVRICRIMYDPKNVAAALKGMLTVLQEQWEEDQTDFTTLQDFARRIVMDMFTIKHPSYADEREVRISRMLNRVGNGYLDPGGNGRGGVHVKANDVEVRQGRYGDVCYIALPLKLENVSAIRSIGFGPCVSDDAFNSTRDMFERASIEVWRSSIPYR